MTITRTFHCDAPECEASAGGDPNALQPAAPGILTVTVSGEPHDLHFCDWDCCLRFAATVEPTMRIDFGNEQEG